MSDRPAGVLQPIASPQGWTILPVHYSHDPAKDEAWRAEQMAGAVTVADWNREMEIDFTAQSGKPAYPNFRRALHVSPDELPYVPTLPLCLCMDFNVSPMVWEVAQIWKGKPRFINEVVLDPATIDECVREFRNMYPAHRAELWIYGDATGRARTAQTAKSDYDLVRLAFRAYSAPLVWKVPLDNPSEKDRVNAFNRMLLGADRQPGILMDPKCKELIADCEEVICRPDGKAILKTYNIEDPYSKRTHGSDGAGYFIWREWPVSAEVIAQTAKGPARKPLQMQRPLGGKL